MKTLIAIILIASTAFLAFCAIAPHNVPSTDYFQRVATPAPSGA